MVDDTGICLPEPRLKSRSRKTDEVLGVLDLAAAVRTGTSHRATGHQALHLCRITDAIRQAAAASAPQPVILGGPVPIADGAKLAAEILHGLWTR